MQILLAIIIYLSNNELNSKLHFSITFHRDFCTNLQREENSSEAKEKTKKSKKAKKSKKSFDVVSREQHIFLQVPEKGDFDLNSVQDSTFFFS